MLQNLTDRSTPESIQGEISGIRALPAVTLDIPENEPLISTLHAHYQAVRLLQNQAETLENYPVFEDEAWIVEVNGEARSCYGYSMPFED